MGPLWGASNHPVGRKEHRVVCVVGAGSLRPTRCEERQVGCSDWNILNLPGAVHQPHNPQIPEIVPWPHTLLVCEAPHSHTARAKENQVCP